MRGGAKARVNSGQIPELRGITRIVTDITRSGKYPPHKWGVFDGLCAAARAGNSKRPLWWDEPHVRLDPKVFHANHFGGRSTVTVGATDASTSHRAIGYGLR